MGPFCVPRSASYHRRAREGAQTCPLRWESAYNQCPPRYRILPTLTVSDLGTGLYGVEGLSHEDLCSTPDTPRNELIDCSEVSHGEKEKMAAERKREGLGKRARSSCASFERNGVKIICVLIDNSHPPQKSGSRLGLSTTYRQRETLSGHSRSSPGGISEIPLAMLASARTRIRNATTPHLRLLAGHVHPPLGCLPRCSFRQISSGRVLRSATELSSGTPAAPCVIHSPQFL
jgi:hypothetical protein